MIEEEIRRKLDEGIVVNKPGVLEHLEALGYEIVEEARLPKTKALFIGDGYADALKAALYSCDNFLLPQDILDIPIPEPIVTEWGYQVGDIVELLEERSGYPVGTHMTVVRVDKGDKRQPIEVDGSRWVTWPFVGTFKLVKKAEPKVTVEMSQETYESLKESLKDAEVVKS